MTARIQRSRAARVLYIHGLESGPQGFKASALRGWFEVCVPDMHMGAYQLSRRNSFLRNMVARSVTRWPWQVRAAAVTDSLHSCLGIQRRAIAQFQPDLVIGSSWGGAVATVLLAHRIWAGPTLLLCPAWKAISRWVGTASLEEPHYQPNALLARLRGVGPDSRRLRGVGHGGVSAPANTHQLIIHGDRDDVVPLADSQALANASGIPLETVLGGSHGLSQIVRDGRLQQWASSLLSSDQRCARQG